MAAIAEIKERIAAALGPDALSEDAELLGGFSSPEATGAPLFAVRPKDAGQVMAVVRLANQAGLNLVPFSSGPPRFRGDTAPGEDGVMVDLSGMDKVVRIDRRNKVAIIEPGVTFARLEMEVEKAGLKVLTPLLPRSTKSVLASYLEREPITIPKYHWDMTDPLLCTEVIFGSGDLFRTGSAAGPGTLEQQWATGAAQKNPMGPAQTDFVRVVQGSQGTMGIVTWASVKLEVLPTLRRMYFAPEKKLERLIEFSYRVMRLKLADEFFILNSFALAGMLGESPASISAIAEKQAPYTLVFCVAGYEYLPERRVVCQENDIAKIAQACGVTMKREVPGAGGRSMMEKIDRPSPEPYYKLRPSGAFREILFLTTMEQVGGFVSVMEAAASRRGYDPERIGVYAQPIQHGRSCHLEFNLYYDPGDEEETARVEGLFTEASAELSAAGAFFSRPYGPWAGLAYARCPDTVKALKMVKGILDPAGVMNRGRLCFEEV